MRIRGYRLTADEQRHVRITLRYLHVRCGTWETLAKALCMQDDSLRKILRGTRAVSPTLAFRLSRFTKVSIEALLAGRVIPMNICPHCGHRTDAA
jgi:hypothetical protein